MKIFSYVLTMADDVDVLPDALSSMAHFSDQVFVVDGMMGSGTLCHHPRYTTPIEEWIKTRPEYDYDDLEIYGPLDSYTWTATHRPSRSTLRETTVPLTIWSNEFKDPAHQRNFTLDMMSRLSEQPDWIVWIDSDEVCSWEFIDGVRPLLDSLSDDAEGVYLKWLTLVQDEKHCVEHMSSWLAHPRIHRPTTGRFQGSWHEHMLIDRSWCVQFDARVIHTRALFTERLRVQRGHDGIASGNTPLWADAKMIDVPSGVTWPAIHWPEGEKETPFK